MTDDLNEAKRRLRTAWTVPGTRASQNQDVEQAKKRLRGAAGSLIGGCVSELQRSAAAELAHWVQESPWRSVLTAFATGAVLAGRDAAALYLITRLVDLAAFECLRSRSRNTAAQGASVHAAAATR